MNERRRENEDSKGKYSWCTFYTSINMEHSKLLKPSQKEKYGRKENNGGIRPIRVIMHIYIYMEMSKWNYLYKHYKQKCLFFKQNVTQEGKIHPVWGWYHWEGECYNEKMKVGKYDRVWCIHVLKWEMWRGWM
jgi:hypothetical protein